MRIVLDYRIEFFRLQNVPLFSFIQTQHHRRATKCLRQAMHCKAISDTANPRETRHLHVDNQPRSNSEAVNSLVGRIERNRRRVLVVSFGLVSAPNFKETEVARLQHQTPPWGRSQEVPDQAIDTAKDAGRCTEILPDHLLRPLNNELLHECSKRIKSVPRKTNSKYTC